MNKFNVLIKIINSLPVFYFYKKMNEELNQVQSKKIAMNTTALFHATSTAMIGLKYMLSNKYSYLIQMNSGGYFIFDLYYMLKNNNIDILRMMYMYHHITGYLYMLLPFKTNYWPQVFFYGELSNIPNYIVYYNIQQEKSLGLIERTPRTIFWMRIQMMVYLIFRIFFLGYYSYKELLHNRNKEGGAIIYSTSILYLFGLVWSIAIVKQNIKIETRKNTDQKIETIKYRP